MNQDQKLIEMKKLWVYYGKFYGTELEPAQIKMYAMATLDLEVSDVQRVMAEFMKSQRRMMLPVDIRDKIHPEMSDDENCQDLARQIIASLARHGYTWPGGYSGGPKGKYWSAWDGTKSVMCDSFKEAVITELGNGGLAVMDRFGGFSRLHDAWAASGDNNTAFFAQLRDLCEVVMKKARLGILDQKIMLPEPEEKKLLGGPNAPMATLGEIMKKALTLAPPPADEPKTIPTTEKPTEEK